MRKILIAAAAAFVTSALAGSANSAECIGACGTLGPNGVVTSPPAGGPNYSFVSTNGGVSGAGQISGVGGTNGSEFVSDVFSAKAGDPLQFYFNYVTSDGAGFSDYAFTALLDSSDAVVAYLFTARTQPTGNTSPGFGLPANSATLTPATTAIIPGGPEWSALGGDSGSCFDEGCGFTGWIQSNYTIAASGDYKIRFGVTNWDDQEFQSGLAFAGLTVAGKPVEGVVPEPTTWALMLAGFLGTGAVLRARRRRLSAAHAG